MLDERGHCDHGVIKLKTKVPLLARSRDHGEPAGRVDSMTPATKTAPVEARLVKLDGQLRHLVRCGSCGQALWVIDDGRGSAPSRLRETSTSGRRYQVDTRTWHPTPAQLKKRYAAKERIRTGQALPNDIYLLRAAHGYRPRRLSSTLEAMDQERRWIPSGWEALTLPVNMVCEECGAVNAVSDPVACVSH